MRPILRGSARLICEGKLRYESMIFFISTRDNSIPPASTNLIPTSSLYRCPPEKYAPPLAPNLLIVNSNKGNVQLERFKTFTPVLITPEVYALFNIRLSLW